MSSDVAQQISQAEIDALFGGAMPKEEIQAAQFLKVRCFEALRAAASPFPPVVPF